MEVHAARPSGWSSSPRAASPHRILQPFGIRPAAMLRAVGIDVRVDSPNVGVPLREHRALMLRLRLTEDVGYNRCSALVLRRRGVDVGDGRAGLAPIECATMSTALPQQVALAARASGAPVSDRRAGSRIASCARPRR
jgi:hypothetical protein